MRPTVIAGNWKMYKDLPETAELLRALLRAVPAVPQGTQVVVCPPFTSLALAGELLRGSPIALGAQNMAEQDEGAFTGEISWKMLTAAGCSHVILGHSERRQYSGETDAGVNRKARTALAHGLTPIICVGETLDEREGGTTAEVVERQVRGTLAGFSASDAARVILAYEPVWAIGTGRTATPAQAQEVHAHIRGLLGSLVGGGVAGGVPIQYGGSVKPENARELLAMPDIDGALVGGACLKAESFAAIIGASAG
jgi:triosephosphate isomerase